jgi:addiction module HigA family antidote
MVYLQEGVRMNTEIDIKTLKKNPEVYRGTVMLMKRADGLFCKHPSDFFKRNDLKHVGSMTNEEVAENLGIAPKHLSSFLNEKVNIEPSFAVRLARVTGFCVETWLEAQRKFDTYVSSNNRLKKG